MRNISWNTTKAAEGFNFSVYEIIGRQEPNAEGSYADIVVLKTGSRATRAQAKGLAQKWCRYLKAQA
jgi:hypothetical protein